MTKNLNNEQRCKKDLILEYKKQHPEKTYQQIADDLHCGKNTVRKWVSKMNKEAGMPGKIKTCNGTWVEDITGQHFNMVTPICITQNKDCRNRWLWKCSCDCGKICYVDSDRFYSRFFCGCLLSKGEQKVQSILQKLNINFVTQYSFSNCINPKTNRHLKFDFYLSKYNLCIEYDGVQHYYYTNSGWNTEEHFKDVKYRDSIKNKFCEDNNINLIRIPYTDYDKIDEQYILDILKPFENQTKDGDANDSAAI